MSLLVWMPLDGNTGNKGLADDGVATIQYPNGVTIEPSPFYQSYHFSTGGHIGVSDTELELPSSFSVAAWVKIDSETSWAQGILGLSTDTIPSINNIISLSYQGSGNIFNVKGNNYSYTIVHDNFQIGEWFHITVVINGSNIKVFINGDLVKEDSIGSHPTLTCRGIALGIDSAYEYYSLIGSINDFRVYDNALSVKEVKELAKGLLVRVPLDWGARPNFISNSYTWMEGNLGTTTGTVINESVSRDDFAPSPYVFSMTLKNDSNEDTVCGVSYSPTDLGIESLLRNATYTLSFWAKIEGDTEGINTGLLVNAIAEGQTAVSNSGFGPLSTAWRKHTYTFKSQTNLIARFNMSLNAKAEYTVKICGLKLELGGATPYIPKEDETIYSTLNFGNVAFEDVSGHEFNVINTGCTNGGISVVAGIPQHPVSITSTDHREVSQELRFAKNMFLNDSKFDELTINLWFLEWNKVADNPIFYSLAGGNFLYTYKVTSTNKVYTNFRGENGYQGQINYNAIPNDDNWHMLTQTFDHGIFKLYIDGVLNATVDVSSSTSYLKCYSEDTDNFYIGYAKDNENNMSAYFSDFRVYSTCLSAEDVLQLYKGRQCIDKTGKLYCNQITEI